MTLIPPTTRSMTVGERIRTARMRLGISQVELARRAGVSRGAIYQWESDNTQQIRADKIPRLAAILGVSVTALQPFGGGTVAPIDKNQKSNYVVLMRWDELGAIGASGKMKMSALTKPKYLEVDLDISPECMALRVADNSMEPGFREQDIVILDPNLTPRDGDHVLVRLAKTEEHIFRRYVPRRADAYDLVAENADYPTVTINAKFPARVMGVLVEHRKKRQR
jgi:transcriptional regulator with XRE-family HTH domain